MYASVGTGTGLEPKAGRGLGLEVLIAWVAVTVVLAAFGQSCFRSERVSNERT